MIGGNCLCVSSCFSCVCCVQTLILRYANIVLCLTKQCCNEDLVLDCVTVDSSYSVPSLLHGISSNISNAT